MQQLLIIVPAQYPSLPLCSRKFSGCFILENLSTFSQVFSSLQLLISLLCEYSNPSRKPIRMTELALDEAWEGSVKLWERVIDLRVRIALIPRNAEGDIDLPRASVEYNRAWALLHQLKADFIEFKTKVEQIEGFSTNEMVQRLEALHQENMARRRNNGGPSQ